MTHVESFYRGKRVLVTGGAGFIGSHLVEKLVALGARVTVLDNFSAGKLSNLQAVFGNISILYSDISVPYNAIKATAHQDIIFHLAALVSVPQSLKYPDLCHSINVSATKSLLEGCVQHNVSTIVYSSSSAVYGDHQGPCSEQDTPRPLTPYAESKLAGERLCLQYAQQHQVKTACLRYFNVYGDRQNDSGFYASVVPKFKKMLKTGEPLTIYGDGNQTRDFIKVTDVVEANLNIAMLKSLNGDVFNIGSGKSITLFELIEQLKQELSVKKSNIIFEPAREGDIVHSQANCSKYMKVIASL